MVRVWTPPPITTGEHFLCNQQSCVLAIAWSHRGDSLAAGDTAGTVRLWRESIPIHTYTGHIRFVRSVAWSPNDRFIASGGDYGDSTVQVWERTHARPLYIHREQYRIFAVSWHPHEPLIASGSFDGIVQVWHAFTGEQRISYRGHNGPIYAVAWSPSGQHIASAGADAAVHVWSPQSFSIDRQYVVYRGHSQAIKALNWSPDGRFIASGGDDRLVHVWTALDGGLVGHYTGHHSWVRSIAWSPDGHSLASASAAEVHVWRPVFSLPRRTG